MKLGSTQYLVLANVAALRAPYAGHKTYAEYTRRMSVLGQLKKRGLVTSLGMGHPDTLRTGTGYRLTDAGRNALFSDPRYQAAEETHSQRSHAKKKPARQLNREIASALAKSHTRSR